MSLDNKLLIVRSNTGGRDVIYVGNAQREGDLLHLTQASMIVSYAEVGASGLAGEPDKATRLRPATGPDGSVWIPMSSVSDIAEADAIAWVDHLGVSR